MFQKIRHKYLSCTRRYQWKRNPILI